MADIETWKAVVGYEGEYEVSNRGRVRSLTRRANRSGSRRTGPYSVVIRGKMLALNTLQGNGYLYVDLMGKGCGGRALVHRVVLEAFVGPCPEGMECRHLDGDRRNNRLDNLCWGTRAENWDDKRRHGTLNILRGEQSPQHKLKASDVARIRERHAAGERQAALGREYGIHQVTVSEIVTRKIWSHV
jgi:hypothetical protein